MALNQYRHSAQVAATFLAPPLIGLAAFSSLHFLELLVGPKAAGLAIKEPEKIGAKRGRWLTCLWSASNLLTQAVTRSNRISRISSISRICKPFQVDRASPSLHQLSPVRDPRHALLADADSTPVELG